MVRLAEDAVVEDEGEEGEEGNQAGRGMHEAATRRSPPPCEDGREARMQRSTMHEEGGGGGGLGMQTKSSITMMLVREGMEDLLASGPKHP